MIEIIKRELNEFRTFAMKGSIVDMAIGIIIGASFTGVVNSLVNDIIMPPLGWVLGRVDFTNLYFVMPSSLNLTEVPHYPSLEAAKAAGAVTINYGVFLNSVLSFIIVAFAVFMLVRAINQIQALASVQEKIEEAETTKPCPRCTSMIPINATKCPKCTADI